jgi:hypothetical protein
MKTLTLGALMVTLSFPGLAAGQSKTLPGEMVTVKAKVEAIESESRTINLRMDDGRIETIVASDEMKTFDQIKVGDVVTAKYYDTITVRKKEPGEPELNTWAKGVTPSASGKPAGTYSSKVADKEALAKLKVGDRVDITWTEALLVSVVPPQ